MPNENKAVPAPLDSKKVAIYIRVSTHWQVDKDSLDVQRRELQAYAQMVLRINDFVVFEDAGYSAKNTDRPDYQKMMARLRSGEFSHLLVWKIDRISRNLLDFSSMYAELKSLGIAFVSMNEQFDTSTAIGEAMLKIILVFAELERNMTAERVTAVMLSRANNGQWNGGRVPFGYKYDKATKAFSIEISESLICKRIFELYDAGGFSLMEIVKYLNDKGFLTRAGKRWSIPGIYTILTNVWYTGAYRYNVHSDRKGYEQRAPEDWITIDAHHEPLIDAITFDRVQHKLARNRRGQPDRNSSRQTKNVHIFAGLLRCGNCGANMSASQDRRRVSGWRPSIYGCSNKRKGGLDCQSKYVSDAYLGPFVFSFISNIIKTKGQIGPKTSLANLEKMLLAGPYLACLRLDDTAVLDLKNALLAGDTVVEYTSPIERHMTSDRIAEIELLRSQMQKAETAIKRLETLYLYSDNGISQTDYVIKHNSLLNSLSELEQRLHSEEQALDSKAYDEQEFIEKASYFVMASRLLSDEPLDYSQYFSKIDPTAPKSFLNATVKEIVVTDGAVTSIEFFSGIKCVFSKVEE